MANKITGRVIVLTPTELITSKSGKSFSKRELVIERTVFDRNTGIPTTDPTDTPIFRIIGALATDLDSIKVGDYVTVHYDLEGRTYVKDNEKRYFTDIHVFRVEPQSASQPAPDVTVATVQQENATIFNSTEQENTYNNDTVDDLPF